MMPPFNPQTAPTPDELMTFRQWLDGMDAPPELAEWEAASAQAIEQAALAAALAADTMSGDGPGRALPPLPAADQDVLNNMTMAESRALADERQSDRDTEALWQETISGLPAERWDVDQPNEPQARETQFYPTTMRRYIRELIGPLPWVRRLFPCTVTAVDRAARTCTVVFAERDTPLEGCAYYEQVPVVGGAYVLRWPAKLPDDPTVPAQPRLYGRPWIKVEANQWLYHLSPDGVLTRYGWPPPADKTGWVIEEVATGLPADATLVGGSTGTNESTQVVLNVPREDGYSDVIHLDAMGFGAIAKAYTPTLPANKVRSIANDGINTTSSGQDGELAAGFPLDLVREAMNVPDLLEDDPDDSYECIACMYFPISDETLCLTIGINNSKPKHATVPAYPFSHAVTRDRGVLLAGTLGALEVVVPPQPDPVPDTTYPPSVEYSVEHPHEQPTGGCAITEDQGGIEWLSPPEWVTRTEGGFFRTLPPETTWVGNRTLGSPAHGSWNYDAVPSNAVLAIRQTYYSAVVARDFPTAYDLVGIPIIFDGNYDPAGYTFELWAEGCVPSGVRSIPYLPNVFGTAISQHPETKVLQIWAGTLEGILYRWTGDGSDTWQPVGEGQTVVVVRRDGVEAVTMNPGGFGVGGAYTLDDTETWQPLPLLPDDTVLNEQPGTWAFIDELA